MPCIADFHVSHESLFSSRPFGPCVLNTQLLGVMVNMLQVLTVRDVLVYLRRGQAAGALEWLADDHGLLDLAVMDWVRRHPHRAASMHGVLSANLVALRGSDEYVRGFYNTLGELALVAFSEDDDEVEEA